MKAILVLLMLSLSVISYSDIKLTLRPVLTTYQDAIGYGAALGLKSDISSFVSSMKPGLFTGLEAVFSTASYSNLVVYDISGGVDLGWRFLFFRNFSVAPFVTIGAGYVNISDTATSLGAIGLMVTPSLNLEFYFNRNWSLGLEAGYRYLPITLGTEPYNVSAIHASLSVSYTFPAGAQFDNGPVNVQTKEQTFAGDIEKIMKEQKLQGSVESASQNEIKLSLSDVLFEMASDKVNQNYIEAIKSIAKKAREYSGLMVVVEGHSDDRGDEVYNALLSANRAKNVADLFIAFGIGSTQVSYKGWGKDKPLVPNTSEANRAKNRRVEISFKFGR